MRKCKSKCGSCCCLLVVAFKGTDGWFCAMWAADTITPLGNYLPALWVLSPFSRDQERKDTVYPVHFGRSIEHEANVVPLHLIFKEKPWNISFRYARDHRRATIGRVGVFTSLSLFLNYVDNKIIVPFTFAIVPVVSFFSFLFTSSNDKPRMKDTSYW